VFRNVVFYDNFTESLSGTWWMFAVQGTALMVLGLLIELFPDILTVMVAATSILVGAVFLSIG
jgi:uncharacterized membrane protein HdeD (DUF308 family)